jgi:hypothetical protein
MCRQLGNDPLRWDLVGGAEDCPMSTSFLFVSPLYKLEDFRGIEGFVGHRNLVAALWHLIVSPLNSLPKWV